MCGGRSRARWRRGAGGAQTKCGKSPRQGQCALSGRLARWGQSFGYKARVHAHPAITRCIKSTWPPRHRHFQPCHLGGAELWRELPGYSRQDSPVLVPGRQLLSMVLDHGPGMCAKMCALNRRTRSNPAAAGSSEKKHGGDARVGDSRSVFLRSLQGGSCLPANGRGHRQDWSEREASLLCCLYCRPSAETVGHHHSRSQKRQLVSLSVAEAEQWRRGVSVALRGRLSRERLTSWSSIWAQAEHSGSDHERNTQAAHGRARTVPPHIEN